MIKANELRIGNWLYDNEVGFKSHFQVKVGDLVDIAKRSCPTYQQIPLTPEILIACGFEHQSNDSYQLDVPLGFCLWGRNGEITVHAEYNDEIGNSVKYLHQLQNLYFALTGEELEISL